MHAAWVAGWLLFLEEVYTLSDHSIYYDHAEVYTLSDRSMYYDPAERKLCIVSQYLQSLIVFGNFGKDPNGMGFRIQYVLVQKVNLGIWIEQEI